MNVDAVVTSFFFIIENFCNGDEDEYILHLIENKDSKTVLLRISDIFCHVISNSHELLL